MTTTTDRVSDLFADAQSLYDDALEMLAQDRIRNAAEKAWGATERATDAMLLARTGSEPQSAGDARRAMLRLSGSSPAINIFQGKYHIRSAWLYLDCYYDGNCEPREDMVALIRATDAYIRDAQALADAP